MSILLSLALHVCILEPIPPPYPMPYPAAGGPAGGGGMPYPPAPGGHNPPYPPSGQTPYPALGAVPYGGGGGGGYPPSYQQQPSNDSGTITQEMLKMSLQSAVEDKVKKELADDFNTKQARWVTFEFGGFFN